LWGDDGGKTAFALLPYITFPTSTDGLGNNAVEGGVIFPLAVSLPYDFDLSLETAASCMKNDDGDGYHEEFIASASLDHQIIGKLSGFWNFSATSPRKVMQAGWERLTPALEYLVTKNIQLDLRLLFWRDAGGGRLQPVCRNHRKILRINTPLWAKTTTHQRTFTNVRLLKSPQFRALVPCRWKDCTTA
jgi:hypothetical protein